MKFDKIWGYQNEGVPFKQGRQDLNFLTSSARHKKFSGYANINNR